MPSGPPPAGVTGVADRLSSVDVASIDAPSGSRLARVSVGVRNELIYDLTGGAGGASPLYRLNVRLSATQLQIIVDINTARPDINNYGIDASLYLDRDCDRQTGCQGSTPSPACPTIFPAKSNGSRASAGCVTQKIAPPRKLPKTSGTGWPRISQPALDRDLLAPASQAMTSK